MTYSEQVLDVIEQNKFSEIDELLEKAAKNDEQRCFQAWQKN